MHIYDEFRKAFKLNYRKEYYPFQFLSKLLLLGYTTPYSYNDHLLIQDTVQILQVDKFTIVHVRINSIFYISLIDRIKQKHIYKNKKLTPVMENKIMNIIIKEQQ